MILIEISDNELTRKGGNYRCTATWGRPSR